MASNRDLATSRRLALELFAQSHLVRTSSRTTHHACRTVLRARSSLVLGTNLAAALHDPQQCLTPDSLAIPATRAARKAHLHSHPPRTKERIRQIRTALRRPCTRSGRSSPTTSAGQAYRGSAYSRISRHMGSRSSWSIEMEQRRVAYWEEGQEVCRRRGCASASRRPEAESQIEAERSGSRRWRDIGDTFDSWTHRHAERSQRIRCDSKDWTRRIDAGSSCPGDEEWHTYTWGSDADRFKWKRHGHPTEAWSAPRVH